MIEVWIVGMDGEMAAEVTTAVGSLGHTPRRVIRCLDGRPQFADGGERRRPDVIVALAASDHAAEEVVRLLELHDGASAPIVVAVDESHLTALPDALNEHELIVRPFSALELGARIHRARSRFSGVGADEVVRCGTMAVNLATYRVTVNDSPVPCSNLEYQLLRFLVTHPQRVLSREALLYGVWGYDYYGGARTVDVHIRRLRAKLGPDNAEHIKTVRGIGYRFEAAA